MTKQEHALEMFERAKIMDAGWREAAEALAALIAAPTPKKAKRNVQSGGRSLSGLTKRLPYFRRQNCGHSFNSAGCAICPQCPRKPAVMKAEAA